MSFDAHLIKSGTSAASMVRQSSLPTTASTISSLLKTLSSSSPLHFNLGLQLHSLSLKLSLSTLPFTATALISFYSRHHSPISALQSFSEIAVPDPHCFSAAISALARHHLPSHSLSLFRRMLSSSIPSSPSPLSSALLAASLSASLPLTRLLHAHSLSSGLSPNPTVSTALLDSYSKSGSPSSAHRIFHEISVGANLVTWNALIASYARQGDAAGALRTFDEMLGREFVPDEYTFLAILAACGGAGMVEEAEGWVRRMGRDYGVEPGVEHWTCLVGAMAKAGRVKEAERLAVEMPVDADKAVWRMILAACLGKGEVGVGGRVAGRLLELDPDDDYAYVMMAKMYGGEGRKGEVAGVWTAMRDRGIRKEGGRSWIQVGGEVHVFLAGDRRHERSVEIYGKLRELGREVEELDDGGDLDVMNL